MSGSYSQENNSKNDTVSPSGTQPPPVASIHHQHSQKEKDDLIMRETLMNNEEESIYRFEKSPWYVSGGEMRDYQIRGLNWLIELYHAKNNGILADEMGLGKTLQTISMIGYLKHVANNSNTIGNNNKFYMVITPKSTLQNWVNEFHRWVPTIRVVSMIGDHDERNDVIQNQLINRQWDVVVTTYEMVIKEKAALRKYKYDYLAIDEAHRIKNENSKLSEVVRQFHSAHRLLITGTPLQNNLHELWALLNFLMPDKFNSAESFDSMFDTNTVQQQQTVVQQLHSILKPYLLRRLKTEVEKRLLPKKEVKVYIGMGALQRELYTKILMKDIDSINVNVKQADKNRLQNILMQLRKCTNHPYLFEGIEPGPPYTTDQHLVDSCGKMVLLDKLLTRLKEQGSRVLIFSQMTSMLDILEDYSRWRGHEYCRLDGQTMHEDRQRSIDEYNAPGSSKFIFMLSTRAGGLGINLTTADVVIIYDSDWNPQVDLQAQDRAHRIGQKKQVRVFRLITEHTVEERIIARAEMKLRLDSLVIQQGRLVDNKSNALQKDEIADMIRSGANYIFRTQGTTDNLDDDIDVLLARGEERTAQMNKKLEEIGNKVEENQLKFDTEDYSVYNFMGENYKNKLLENGEEESGVDVTNPLSNFIQIPKRKRTAHYAFGTLNDDNDSNNDSSGKKRGDKDYKANLSKIPRLGKIPTMLDYQFYPKELAPIVKKETLFYKKMTNFRVPVGEENRKEKQQEIIAAEPLTEEEEIEKKKLVSCGFGDWNKKDFYAFIRACEAYGRNNLEAISVNVNGKTPDQVKSYFQVFWARINEVQDYQRYVKQVEKGERKIEQRNAWVTAVREKMSLYRDPFKQLKIVYNGNKSKFYSDEEDKFLICAMYKYGGLEDNENVYEIIRQKIRQTPEFRMSWYLRSRTAEELRRRCMSLINLIQKEKEVALKKLAETDVGLECGRLGLESQNKSYEEEPMIIINDDDEEGMDVDEYNLDVTIEDKDTIDDSEQAITVSDEETELMDGPSPDQMIEENSDLVEMEGSNGEE